MTHTHVKNQKGFTLIETLVAILILMMSIAGPLSIANKGLTDAIYARDQLSASYLAQDAMEYVKNVRDNNLISNPSRLWLTNLSQCTPSNPCSVDTLAGNPSTGSGISNCGTNCLLYKKSDGYTPDPNGNAKTQFSRYFYIKPIPNNTDEAKIVVIVNWANGKFAYQVAYENEIFNVIK